MLLCLALIYLYRFKFDKHTLTFGANIFNIFDEPYAVIYMITGTADSPGEYYDDFVGKSIGILL